MYIPSQFSETNPSELLQMTRSYPLATIVIHAEAGMDANHLPLIVDGGPDLPLSLIGHISKHNPWAKFVDKQLEAMVIFQGPSGYISPSWYPEKQQHGRVVPTWNYVAVHMYGMLRFHVEEKWLLRQVNQLTDQQEARMQVPWSVADAPSEYINKRLQQIVGIEVVIHKMEGKWKLSQNHSESNREGAADGLLSIGNEVLCKEMRRATSKDKHQNPPEKGKLP